MQRIETATRVPDLHGAGKDGFTAGDTLTGTPATSMSPAMWNAVQEELCGLIEAWLGPLDAASYLQLRNAIDARIAAALVGSGVGGKVNKAGDGMTGALSIITAALQLSLQHSTNTATLQDHLRLFRGTGAGTRASLQTLGDAANGLSEIDLNFLSAANALVKAFKFKNTGRMEVGADPVLPMEVTTKQFVEALLSTEATSAEVLAGLLTSKFLSPASALAGLLGAGGTGADDYVTIPYRDRTSGVRRNLIVQWGVTGVIGVNINSTITLPITFPNAGRVAIAMPITTGSGLDTICAASIFSTSQIKVFNGDQNQNQTFGWLALGY